MQPFLGGHDPNDTGRPLPFKRVTASPSRKHACGGWSTFPMADPPKRHKTEIKLLKPKIIPLDDEGYERMLGAPTIR